MPNKTEQRILLAAVFVLFQTSIILTIWLPATQAFRAVFGLFFIFFVPGFLISDILSSKLKATERWPLSFIISLVAVTVVIYYSNKLKGMPIAAKNVFTEILILCSALLLISMLQRRRRLKFCPPNNHLDK